MDPVTGYFICSKRALHCFGVEQLARKRPIYGRETVYIRAYRRCHFPSGHLESLQSPSWKHPHDISVYKAGQVVQKSLFYLYGCPMF
ncbi:hypothetical protein SADUNF_Sadunf14G0061700 [Salix dunnii]|uniref:Uncharacterized protein n=1 Tax=Salix dunnii TaxID=1413687 RepID=A0A835JG12_9ROSI|nr:hypothetical protein SADUNF_Sadunf14G0061700 [Salix dunnii]